MRDGSYVLGTYVALMTPGGFALKPRCPHPHAVRAGGCGHGLGRGIVRIEDGVLEFGTRKEKALGLLVGLHGAVIVEMVAREVREDADADRRARKTPLDEPD